MPEINNGLAAQIQPPQSIDPYKALSTLSQLELARAHAGLYGLQAQQQVRQLEAIRAGAGAYRAGTDPVDAYLGAGGSPEGAVPLQNVTHQRDLLATNRLLPAEQASVAAAGHSNVETDKAQSAIYGQIGNVLATNGTAGIPVALEIAKNNHMQVPPLLIQRVQNMPDEGVRQVGKQLQAYGTPSATATETVARTPGQAIYSRGDLSFGGGAPGAQPPSQNYGGQQRVLGTGDIIGNPQFPPLTPPAGAGAQAGLTPNQVVGKNFPTMNGQQIARGGPQPLVPGLSPSQMHEQETYGKALGAVLPRLDEAGDAAVKQNAILDQMQVASQSWRMGWGANAKQVTNQWLQGLGEAFPLFKELPAWDGVNKATGDFQDFYKLSTELVRQATKATSPRASQQEMMFIAKSLPGPDLSRGGFDAVTGQMGGLNDFLHAEQIAGHRWFDKYQTMDGFESYWNQHISPGAFIAHRLSSNKDILQEMKINMEKTPQGKAMLSDIIQQLNWGKEAGVF